MSASTGPLIPRRRLGAEFRRLREERHELLAQTAKKLMFSSSKLSRIEKGQAEPQPRDVRDIIEHFGHTDTEFGDHLRALAAESRIPGWWQTGRYDMPGRLDTYISYESVAIEVRDYVPSVLPGLLQTPDYARAIISRFVPDLSPAEVTEQVALRMERQANLLDRPEPPHLVFAIPESVLPWSVEPAGTLSAQIRHMIGECTEKGIELHIVPFNAGHFRGMDSGFTLFHFSDPDDLDVVARTTTSSVEFLDADEQLAEHRGMFGRISEMWLSTADSLAHLERYLTSPTS